MNPSSTYLPDTRDADTRSDTSETPRRPVCGTFVRGTITGRILTCGRALGHLGDHQGQQHTRRPDMRHVDRAGALR